MQTFAEAITLLGNNAVEGVANDLNLTITISVADLQAIQQRIADLKESTQRNPRRHYLSEPKPDY